MKKEYSIKTKMLARFTLYCLNNNKLDEKILERITFQELIYLSNYVLDNEQYERVMGKIIALQEERIKKKVKMGEQLKVAFLCDSSSVWGYDKIIEKLKQEEKIELYAIVPLLKRAQEDNSDIDFNKKYKSDIVQFLKKKGIKFYVVKEKEDAKWGNKLPDILFSQKPYEELYMQNNFNLHNMSCSCMQMFIPYSFWVDKVSDIIFATNYMKIFSKIFAPSKVHMDYFTKIVRIDKKRIVYSGYPKVDCYYSAENKDENVIWKNGEGKRHIIYAPGLVNDGKYSTFGLNYKVMLDIARKSKNTVSWVIRLHPMMAEGCIEQRIFKNINEWNQYLNEWNSLENATVSINGSYEEIFKTSDGMIMDSVSFLPSYQYTGKPLLLLTRKTQEFNKLGQMLKEVVYTAQAKKREQIEQFICNVIINEQDEKKEMREAFFKENLDYYSNNKILASDCIANYILEYCK